MKRKPGDLWWSFEIETPRDCGQLLMWDIFGLIGDIALPTLAGRLSVNTNCPIPCATPAMVHDKVEPTRTGMHGRYQHVMERTVVHGNKSRAQPNTERLVLPRKWDIDWVAQ